MPYVHVRITREPINTPAAKRELIRQVTDAFVNVLDKDPNTTFVVIEEVEPENWGIGGMTTPEWRAQKANDG